VTVPVAGLPPGTLAGAKLTEMMVGVGGGGGGLLLPCCS
jgi:hypothetical protein